MNGNKPPVFPKPVRTENIESVKANSNGKQSRTKRSIDPVLA